MKNKVSKKEEIELIDRVIKNLCDQIEARSKNCNTNSYSVKTKESETTITYVSIMETMRALSDAKELKKKYFSGTTGFKPQKRV